MDLRKYRTLTLSERDDVINSKGEMIAYQMHANGYNYFYLVDTFFVEVIMMNDEMSISAAIPFTHGERYERMVEVMPLEMAWCL